MSTGASNSLLYQLSLISTTDAAKILGVTAGRVRQLVESGSLPCAGRIGYSFVFSEPVLREFKKRHRPSGRPRGDIDGPALTLAMVEDRAKQPAKPKTKSQSSVALTISDVERKNGGRA